MVIKNYLKFIQRPKNKVNLVGKRRRIVESLKAKGYKIRKATFYRLQKRRKKYKQNFLRKIRLRFLKSMNMRKIKKNLTSIYIKFNRFYGLSNRMKHFIFKKHRQNAMLGKRYQFVLKKRNLYNYAKRSVYLFKMIHKLKKEENNKNYIYKYFKKLYKKQDKKFGKSYIVTYFKHIYKKKIKFNIFKYCKDKIPTQGRRINILTTLRRLLIFRLNKKKFKNDMEQYNRNKLSWIFWIVKNRQLIFQSNLYLVDSLRKKITTRNTIYYIIASSLYQQLLRIDQVKKNLKKLLFKKHRVNIKPIIYQYSQSSRYNSIYQLKNEFFFYFKRRQYNILSYFFFDKFKNRYMFKGQRSLITSIFNKVFLKFKYRFNLNFQKLLKTLLLLMRPIFNFVYRRKAKQKIAVPIPIKWHKQYKTSIKWIFLTINDRFCRSLEKKLLRELSRILLKKKNTLLRRRNLFYHNIVDNRFYTQFRWK
jgi:ribosomal protein S7